MSFYDEVMAEGAKAKQELGTSGGQGADISFFYLKEGRNKYRFVPYRKEKPFRVVKHFGKPFGMKLPGTGSGGVWNCTMEKYKKCPLCSNYIKSSEIDSKKAFSKRPNVAYRMYVIDEAGKPGILEMDIKEFSLFLEFVEKCKKEKDYGQIDILSLEAGSFFIIEKEKKDKRWTWNFSRPITTHTMTEEEMNKIFENVPAMERFVKVFTPEDLELALNNDFSFLKKDEVKKEVKSESKEVEEGEGDVSFEPEKLEKEDVKKTDDLASKYGLE